MRCKARRWGRVCVCVCVCVCVSACVRVCVCATVHVCVYSLPLPPLPSLPSPSPSPLPPLPSHAPCLTAMLYGLYDLSSNQTLHTPSPDALSNNGFHRLTGVTHQSQAVIPPQFVYDRLHGTNVTRPLTYVYLVVKGVSQHLPCDK